MAAFPMLAPAASDARLSDETVELIRTAMADVTRTGINASSGLQGYELEAPSKAIVPVITPLVNMIPRKQGTGNPICHWIAITSFDSARLSGVVSDGSLPSEVSYTVAAMQNPYKTIGLRNSVSFEAEWTGASLEGDVRARRVGELLYALKMKEEQWLLTASQYIMVPARPLVTQTAATGGHFSDSTKYWVQVTAINANGETTGSAATSFTTPANSGGNTGNLVVTIFTVPNATGYNVYIGSGASQPATSAMWLQSSISGNTNAAQPTFNASITLANGGNILPSGEAVGPTVVVTDTAVVATSGTALSSVAANTAKSFIDGSGNILMWDGLIAQALGNATTSNGITLGAQVGVPGAASGVAALSDIQALLTASYLQAAGDPDLLVCNPLFANQLTNLTIAAGQTRYVVEASQPGSSGKLTAQYRVTHFLNQATGKEMPIIMDRYCPVDTVIGLPMSVPFASGLSNALEIETNRSYWGIDYAITDSSWKFGDYVNEALKVYFLGGLVVLRGMTPSN